MYWCSLITSYINRNWGLSHKWLIFLYFWDIIRQRLETGTSPARPMRGIARQYEQQEQQREWRLRWRPMAVLLVQWRKRAESVAVECQSMRTHPWTCHTTCFLNHLSSQYLRSFHVRYAFGREAHRIDEQPHGSDHQNTIWAASARKTS